MSKKKLTKKQRIFVEEYIRCWNGAASARAAGYSAKTAREMAYDLLTIPHIKDAIETRLAEIRMSTNEFYARLSEQARANIAEFIELYTVPILDKDGDHIGDRQAVRIKDEALQRYGHLIKSITPTSNGDIKIELHDAQRALELTGKTYSLFVDKDDKGNPIRPVVNVYIPRNERDGNS